MIAELDVMIERLIRVDREVDQILFVIGEGIGVTQERVYGFAQQMLE